MKLFNEEKINRPLINILELSVIFIGFFLKLLKRNKKHVNPSLLVVDGFLIGDTVLLRPLLNKIIEKYAQTHKIILISGAHAKFIMHNFLHKIDILEFQFPWATYDYGFSNLKKLFLLWLKLYRLRIDIAIECRGDFRSIAWTHLTCPIELIGFDFIGGSKLLTKILPDDKRIAHLFEHVQRIGHALNAECNETDVVLSAITKRQKKMKKIIGVSFSGSQILKTLPKNIGADLLHKLIDNGNYEILYLLSPQERFLSATEAVREFGNGLQIFQGSFAEYFDILQHLDCYIGMDSGGGHLCSLWGIPSIIIFGTQNSWYCKPIGSHPLLCLETKENLRCRPCYGVKCTNSTSYQQCLNSIDFSEIFPFVKNFID